MNKNMWMTAHKVKLLLVIIVCLLLSLSAQAQDQSQIEPQADPASSAAPQASQPFDWVPDGGIPGLPALTVNTNADGSEDYSVTIQILAIMTALTFIPALLMMVTSFTRIIIVFSILRQAIGLQQSPSNQILIGLALFLSMFVMAPVFNAVNESALQPYLQEQISGKEALTRTAEPFHSFMMSQTRDTDLQLFVKISDSEAPYAPENVPFTILIPAFVTSELKTAFQIGFILFIPFLVIDIVVASVLMAMGMMMLSPLIISLPFKIMLFVLVDGWAMIIGTLAASFGT